MHPSTLTAFRDEMEKIAISPVALGAGSFAKLEARVGTRAGWDAARVNKSMKRMVSGARPKPASMMAGVNHAAPTEMLASSGPVGAKTVSQRKPQPVGVNPLAGKPLKTYQDGGATGVGLAPRPIPKGV